MRENCLAIPTTNFNPDLATPPLKENQCDRDCCVKAPEVAQATIPEPCTPSPYNLNQCEDRNNQRNLSQPNKSEQTLQVPKGILKNKDVTGSISGGMDNGIDGQFGNGVDPATLVPVPNSLRPVPPGEALCYLPQPEDQLIVNTAEGMGPIGPWATGRVDWGPLAGLTGTRPIVDKYSIARFSEGEWRQHNKDMLDRAAMEQHKANLYLNFLNINIMEVL